MLGCFCVSPLEALSHVGPTPKVSLPLDNFWTPFLSIRISDSSCYSREWGRTTMLDFELLVRLHAIFIPLTVQDLYIPALSKWVWAFEHL